MPISFLKKPFAFVKLNKRAPFDISLLSGLGSAGTPSEFNIQCANREKPSSPGNHKNSTGAVHKINESDPT